MYFTAPEVDVWAQEGTVDHDITKVVAGIADTALDPVLAAQQTVGIFETMSPPP